MLRHIAFRCAALFCAMSFLASAAPVPTFAQGTCANLLGKQVTLHGSITYVERLQIGNTKFDYIVARTSEPACGTIQTTAKWQSCNVGMKFTGTGQLRAGPASRSAGSKKAGATDYGFEPISDENLCR